MQSLNTRTFERPDRSSGRNSPRTHCTPRTPRTPHNPPYSRCNFNHVIADHPAGQPKGEYATKPQDFPVYINEVDISRMGFPFIRPNSKSRPTKIEEDPKIGRSHRSGSRTADFEFHTHTQRNERNDSFRMQKNVKKKEHANEKPHTHTCVQATGSPHSSERDSSGTLYDMTAGLCSGFCPIEKCVCFCSFRNR